MTVPHRGSCNYLCSAYSKANSVSLSSQSGYDSSDDDYAGVDLVSDSEEDEADVDEVEEQVIIESEQSDADDDLLIPPRPQQDEDEISWNGFDDSHFDDHMARMEDSTMDNAIWAASSHVSDDEQEKLKKVHWDLSDSEEEEENFGLPDIFVPQSNLALSFRRQIEDDDEQGSDDSFWGHHKPHAVPAPEQNDDSESSSDSDSSSYDSSSM